MMMLTMAKFVPQSPAPSWHAARHIGHCRIRRRDTRRQREGQQKQPGQMRRHTGVPLEDKTGWATCCFFEPWRSPIVVRSCCGLRLFVIHYCCGLRIERRCCCTGKIHDNLCADTSYVQKRCLAPPPIFRPSKTSQATPLHMNTSWHYQALDATSYPPLSFCGLRRRSAKRTWFLLASARFRQPRQYVCPHGNDTGSWYSLFQGGKARTGKDETRQRCRPERRTASAGKRVYFEATLLPP